MDLHLELAPRGEGRRSALERALRDAIRTGRLAPLASLPSSRALAAELGLSRGTVSAAYGQLVAEGYLTAQRGSGTVVSSLAQTRPARRTPAPAGAPPQRHDPRHDLRPGQPDVSQFPVPAWLRATRRVLSRVPWEAYGYGDPRGRAELRTVLAEYLGRARGVLAVPEQVIITSGYAQALALLGRVLAEDGTTTVWMEDPCLDFHRDIVRHAGLSVAGLPVDDRGARTGQLPLEAGAVVLTPAHQYPAGATLHPARRHALAEWARSSGGLVIEDDYDGEFRYDRQPVGAVQGTAPDHVVYAGTTAKTLGPALRLGWMVLPRRLVEPVAEAKRLADHHTETLGQLALAELIAVHAYDRHIRACRLRYRRRRDLLLARLPGPAVRGVAAGLHALVSVPSEAEVMDLAAREGLAIGGLGAHWHQPGDHPQGVLVGFGTPSESAYPSALDALVRVLRAAGVR
ncbi:MAG TPA: PLP-dependent aminotransferase family protein [Streptosporangiaceae bacterium]|nr:PLP-dependent aminotransferase family protein [Streptosporangiaceae bacterium]